MPATPRHAGPRLRPLGDPGSAGRAPGAATGGPRDVPRPVDGDGVGGRLVAGGRPAGRARGRGGEPVPGRGGGDRANPGRRRRGPARDRLERGSPAAPACQPRGRAPGDAVARRRARRHRPGTRRAGDRPAHRWRPPARLVRSGTPTRTERVRRPLPSQERSSGRAGRSRGAGRPPRSGHSSRTRAARAGGARDGGRAGPGLGDAPRSAGRDRSWNLAPIARRGLAAPRRHQRPARRNPRGRAALAAAPHAARTVAARDPDRRSAVGLRPDGGRATVGHPRGGGSGRAADRARDRTRGRGDQRPGPARRRLGDHRPGRGPYPGIPVDVPGHGGNRDPGASAGPGPAVAPAAGVEPGRLRLRLSRHGRRRRLALRLAHARGSRLQSSGRPPLCRRHRQRVGSRGALGPRMDRRGCGPGGGLDGAGAPGCGRRRVALGSRRVLRRAAEPARCRRVLCAFGLHRARLAAGLGLRRACPVLAARGLAARRTAASAGQRQSGGRRPRRGTGTGRRAARPLRCADRRRCGRHRSLALRPGRACRATPPAGHGRAPRRSAVLDSRSPGPRGRSVRAAAGDRGRRPVAGTGSREKPAHGCAA